MRLDNYLTKAAGLTRSEAKQCIKKGRVRVNGAQAKRADQKIAPEADMVCLDQETLSYAAYHYVMLYKPAGVVSATRDARERTVLDLVDGERLFPVGRLDKDTEGLLLLTDDGALAHRLLSPRKHVDKRYFAKLDGPVGEREIALFAEGVDIGDAKPTLPARLERAERPGEVYITLREGRFHQIKRMAHAVGREVLYLKRLSMGSLVLDESLKPGESRPLTETEIRELGGTTDARK